MAYCEFCHTDHAVTGPALRLPDCPNRFDPYADENQPALWGSMWGTDMDGQKRPPGKPEEIPTETIITKRKR